MPDTELGLQVKIRLSPLRLAYPISDDRSLIEADLRNVYKSFQASEHSHKATAPYVITHTFQRGPFSLTKSIAYSKRRFTHQGRFSHQRSNHGRRKPHEFSQVAQAFSRDQGRLTDRFTDGKTRSPL